MKNNFTIEGRLGKLKDPQRNYMWEIDIIDQFNPLSNFLGSNNLKFRVKNLNTPSRSIEVIDTWFYGLKQSIPGRTTFTNQITMTIEETQDLFVINTIYDWMESITSVDFNNPFGTLSKEKTISKNMYIRLLKNDGNQTTSVIEVKNIYPVNINETSLDYSSNDSVKFDITFNYDYWKLVKLPIF